MFQFLNLITYSDCQQVLTTPMRRNVWLVQLAFWVVMFADDVDTVISYQ
jgi:hypothetical protein